MKSLKQAFCLALIYAVVYLGSGTKRLDHPVLLGVPAQAKFEHDEFIRYTVRLKPQRLSPHGQASALMARILYKGARVITIGR